MGGDVISISVNGSILVRDELDPQSQAAFDDLVKRCEACEAHLRFRNLVGDEVYVLKGLGVVVEIERSDDLA